MSARGRLAQFLTLMWCSSIAGANECEPPKPIKVKSLCGHVLNILAETLNLELHVSEAEGRNIATVYADSNGEFMFAPLS